MINESMGIAGIVRNMLSITGQPTDSSKLIPDSKFIPANAASMANQTRYAISTVPQSAPVTILVRKIGTINHKPRKKMTPIQL